MTSQLKILVLGASNEILTNGYVSAISSTELLNASTGGCCVSAGVVNYLKHGQPRADFVLLSFELNEHGIILSGLRSESEVRLMWEWLILKNRASGTLPVVVVLPRLMKGKLVRTATCDIHKEIAGRHGLPFVDAAEIILEAYSGGIAVEKLMRDNAHMSLDVAHLLGEHLGNYLHELDREPLGECQTFTSTCDFKIVGSADFQPSRQTFRRKTSLVAADLIRFVEGDSFQIPAEPGETLIALSVNRRSMPGASIMLQDRVKPLYFREAKTDGYMNVVVDLAGGVIGDSGVITCDIGSPSMTPTEPTWLSGLAPGVGDMDGVVEIEAALICMAENVEIEGSVWAPVTPFSQSHHGHALRQELLRL